MAYQAFYRKYRPTTFDKIVGQENICKTLANQIKTGQISHAYLFTGTRGVGKTTIARILANAINCTSPINGNPCKKCDNCVSGGVDVIEMDGASNNSVDQAREIREKVQYLPANGKYKVYIIDEVHMLTGSAFNALLKTLEEPPKHVVFILCTTEVHKIPATILSRCMRFDFSLIPTTQIAKLISGILDDNKVKYTPEAVNAIALAGEGSARDALSVADRCVALGDELTYEMVLGVLGTTNKYTIIKFGKAILDNDIATIMTLTNSLMNQGKSVSLLAKDLLSLFRDMMVIKTCKNPNELLLLPNELYENMKSVSDTANVKKLLYAMSIYSDLDARLRMSLEPRLLFEATTLRLADSSGENNYDGLEMRVRQLEKRGVTPLKKDTPTSTTPTNVKEIADRDFSKAKPIWASVLQTIRQQNLPMLSTMLSQITNVWCENAYLVVQCNPTQYNTLSEKNNLALLKDIVKPYNVGIKLAKQTFDENHTKQLERLAGDVEVI